MGRIVGYDGRWLTVKGKRVWVKAMKRDPRFLPPIPSHSINYNTLNPAEPLGKRYKIGKKKQPIRNLRSTRDNYS